MNLIIRDATPEDVDTIVAFNAAMAEETEARTLDSERLRHGVRAILGDASRGQYWIAAAGGETVGQVMATREWSDWRNGWFWWLQSVYVAPPHRRRGVFRALYARVRDEARNAGACGLRLYVDRRNERAQRTYESLGMNMTEYRVMETLFTGDE